MTHTQEKFPFVYRKTKQMYWIVEKVESVLLQCYTQLAGKNRYSGFLGNGKALQLVLIPH